LWYKMGMVVPHSKTLISHPTHPVVSKANSSSAVFWAHFRNI
jgi:hypothetical protein